MKETPQNRTARAVRYVLRRAGRELFTIQVFKLVYLADVESHRYLRRSISGLKYILWNHGPFDKAMYRTLKALEKSGEIKTRPAPTADDDSGGKLFSATSSTIDEPLPVDERAIFDYVVTHFAHLPPWQLLRYVYGSEPMKSLTDKTLGMAIDLASLDGTAPEAQSGINAAEFFEAEEQLRSGKGIPWTISLLIDVQMLAGKL